MSDHIFTWDRYRAILAAGLEAGYRYASFGDDVDGKRIYLRHDIDNDITVAHRMAALEKEMGVQATYLVLIRSANYNAAEGRNLRMLAEMADMGHDIGLHFSLEDHPQFARGHDLVELIRSDADLLATMLGAPVTIFGFHNPTEAGQFQVDVSGMINTYADRYYKNIYYMSESNMRWRDGCPGEKLIRGRHKIIQLLVHPLSYAGDLASDYDVLIHFLELKLSDLFEYNLKQNRVLREAEYSVGDVLKELSSIHTDS